MNKIFLLGLLGVVAVLIMGCAGEVPEEGEAAAREAAVPAAPVGEGGAGEVAPQPAEEGEQAPAANIKESHVCDLLTPEEVANSCDLDSSVTLTETFRPDEYSTYSCTYNISSSLMFLSVGVLNEKEIERNKRFGITGAQSLITRSSSLSFFADNVSGVGDYAFIQPVVNDYFFYLFFAKGYQVYSISSNYNELTFDHTGYTSCTADGAKQLAQLILSRSDRVS